MRTEDLKRFLLKKFKGREFYGYEIHKELSSEGFKVEINRLYRILNEMLKEGLLESRWERSRVGPEKRVYQLGKRGRAELNRILLEAIETVHAFYGEYLLSLPSESNVFGSVCRLLTEGLKGQGNVAYVTAKYSAMHDRMVRNLHEKMPQGRIYLVKPAYLKLNLNLDNLLFLNGSYSDIPLKDGFIDLVVVADLPQKDSLEKSLREWHRVLRPNGTVAMLMPTILIEKYEDPLTIGNFIERYEHETVRKDECIGKEFLQELVMTFFQKVEEKQFIHLTILLVHEPQSLSNDSLKKQLAKDL